MQEYDLEVVRLREELCRRFIASGEIDTGLMGQLKQYLVAFKAGERLPAKPTMYVQNRRGGRAKKGYTLPPPKRPRVYKRGPGRGKKKEIICPPVYMAW